MSYCCPDRKVSDLVPRHVLGFLGALIPSLQIKCVPNLNMSFPSTHDDLPARHLHVLADKCAYQDASYSSAFSGLVSPQQVHISRPQEEFLFALCDQK